MAKFIVRVELEGETSKASANYEKLHGTMAAEGFKRTVSIDGLDYDLPHATYKLVKECSVQECPSQTGRG